MPSYLALVSGGGGGPGACMVMEEFLVGFEAKHFRILQVTEALAQCRVFACRCRKSKTLSLPSSTSHFL